MSDDLALMPATKVAGLSRARKAPAAAGVEAAAAWRRGRGRRAHPARARTQNWVLDPVQDTVLIIAAPLLVLAIAVLAFRMLPAASATSLIIVSHVVLTVAHHLPTFIRIYGDVELFKRFRWSFPARPGDPAGVLGGGARLHQLSRTSRRVLPLPLHHAGAMGSVALPATALRIHAHLRPRQRSAQGRWLPAWISRCVPSGSSTS